MSDDQPDAPTGRPVVDGRRRGDVEAELREMVPYYVDRWEPDEGDVGTTLLALFSELAEEVTERLDRVPRKHRVSFFDTLGFGRRPPQPARLPLSVAVADRAGENVTVPAGARATAEPPDGPERLFEVPAGGAFDATPANLQAVYSVAPDRDAIHAHHDALTAGRETELFAVPPDTDRQEHAFYVGDAERLSVGSGSTLRVELDTDADRSLLEGALRWEYHGERTVDGETVEDWHPLPGQVDLAGLLAGADPSTLDAILFLFDQKE